MPVEAEPTPTTPDHGELTPEKLAEMDAEELQALKKKLEEEVASHQKTIDEKEDVIQKGIEKKPRIKAALDKLRRDKKEELEELREKRREQKEEGEDKHVAKLKQYLARVETNHFVELTPERYFYDPDFMRYVPGNKYLALMSSTRIDAEKKEKATRARFQFCFDWYNSPEVQKYREKKRQYLDGYNNWLEEVKTNPDAPEPKEPKDPEGNKDIRETFRNDIRTIGEYAVIHNYFPELFDEFQFIGHTRFPIIAEIRRSPEFAGRGRYIREVKFGDFLDDIIKPHLETRDIRGNGKASTSIKYFETFDVNQLRSLRRRLEDRVKGKERTEMAGAGSRTWKSPVTLDLMDRTICRGFSNSDEGDKRVIAVHCLIALASGDKMSDANKDALAWMRGERTGRAFYSMDDEFVREVERETGIDVFDKVNKEYPLDLK